MTACYINLQFNLLTYIHTSKETQAKRQDRQSLVQSPCMTSSQETGLLLQPRIPHGTSVIRTVHNECTVLHHSENCKSVSQSVTQISTFGNKKQKTPMPRIDVDRKSMGSECRYTQPTRGSRGVVNSPSGGPGRSQVGGPNHPQSPLTQKKI